MPKIFISYRRSDSEDVAGRIYDRLVTHFGQDAIFFDVDAIPIGVDVRDYIKESLSQCSVVLAVIGNTWLTVTDSTGNRRLDNPADWVRLELEEALKRKGKVTIVPVLVRRAIMPAPSELPMTLVNLAYLNATQARPDPDFHSDVNRLIVQLERYFDQLNAASAPVSAPAVAPKAYSGKPPPVPETHRQEAVGWAPPTGPNPPPNNSTFDFEVVIITRIEKSLFGLGQANVITSRSPGKADCFSVNLSNSVLLEMVRIPAGQFLMGSPDSEGGAQDWEGLQHRVSVPEFWLGKYPVTQAQYHVVMGKNPSRFSKNGTNRPVEQV
ncbi:MAG: TIR domain-containing protein, partial [Cyanobacteria bacterium J06638_6]